VFAAAAQKSTHRDAKLLLLKRYKDLDYAGSFLQRLQPFPKDSAEHAASVS